MAVASSSLEAGSRSLKPTNRTALQFASFRTGSRSGISVRTKSSRARCQLRLNSDRVLKSLPRPWRLARPGRLSGQRARDQADAAAGWRANSVSRSISSNQPASDQTMPLLSHSWRQRRVRPDRCVKSRKQEIHEKLNVRQVSVFRGTEAQYPTDDHPDQDNAGVP